MSEKIMQENLENCLQISEQELESVVGGALAPSSSRGRKGGFSGLPLPRTGGIAPATSSSAAVVATILGVLVR
jgi:hypothetical protein